MAEIHPQAIVDPSAELGEDVTIGPGAIIEKNVIIGDGTSVGPYAIIYEGTTIGKKNQIGPFVTIGAAPQHLACQGRGTRVEIGDENIIREYASIHRGTTLDQGLTRIGNRCFIMAYAHVGHDCVLADEVILTNTVNLGGHVKIGKGVVIGGNSAVHQFCRLGELSFVAGLSGVDKDVPPFVRVFGSPAKIVGLNLVGLRRAKLSSDAIRKLSKALKIYLREGTLKEALARIEESFPEDDIVQKFVAFLKEDSKRGAIRKALGE
ncbi:acyl-ACP--UDP-N-acetylglucosamine O-acyltransferase [Thermodesulfatator atlanticus]|uniref:acyl-ACP--UDP-N-acetylglucosamine O-acyltransferase n=1 Tax=Thermodesulfatator atlanticus TaxID=501497 RepID=UPI0003B3A9EF|nr:acyl-ACP--UDP-N-acetylglucosamine O-acyltransferase [Thermodesulfatator atlanticus]